MALRLHSRLVLLNLTVLGATSLLLGIFLTGVLRRTFESEIESQLNHSATLAKEYLRSPSTRSDPIRTARELSRLLSVRVTLIQADGRVLADSDATREDLAAAENMSTRPEFISARREGQGTSIRQNASQNVPSVYVATELDDGSVLRLSTPLASVEALLSDLWRKLALAMVIGLAMTLALGYMVYAVVSRPLRRVAEASHRLAFGRLDSEIPVAGDRDLATVGSALNAMARNLQLKIRELQGDKHRTEAIIAAMSSGVVVFDRSARVILSNQSIQDLLDIPGDTTGRIPMELVRHPSIEAAVRTALSGAEAPAIELTTRRDRVLLAKAAPVRSLGGDVELVVMVVHDLTEMRRTEKMRKDFVANVSHEFKTPLTSIRGYAETLLTAEPNDPELKREFLGAIERNAAVLQTLVEDLLVLANLESELPLTRDRFDLRELISRQFQSRSHLLSSRKLQAHVVCPSVEIEADRGRLSLALSNLLDNAIHYNRTGGQVRVVGTVADHHCRIQVEDTGDGIPASELVRVFERFYRVDKSRTRDSGGTGLGLAIAKHAIESQGGTLSVSSKLGVGSTFTILLPMP